MVRKVPHPKLKFAYDCDGVGCDRGPFRWRDQAEDCERNHQVLQQRREQDQQPREIEQEK